jgi:hypothetical protein
MSHAAAAPARPAPAAGGDAAPAKPGDPVVMTAERLFIELASGAMVIADNNAKVPVDAKSLANLSFELSKAFHEVEVSRREKPVLTTATFDANMCDFDAWTSAASTPKAA